MELTCSVQQLCQHTLSVVCDVQLAVQCIGFGRVASNGTACENKDATGGAENLIVRGIAHMCYDCRDHSIWFLTYVLPGTVLQDTVKDMWVDTNCGAGTAVCTGPNSDKTLAYSGNSAAGSCESKGLCAVAEADRTAICCLNMWPVHDLVKTIEGGKEVFTDTWVGYIAKGWFTLDSSNTCAWDTVLLHWDWKDIAATGGSTPNTGSTAAKVGTGGNGIILDCASKILKVESTGLLPLLYDSYISCA
jgi:hypothetical protein